MAVSHDARKIATAEPGRIVRLWNAETGQVLQSNEEIEEVASLSWSPKGRQLALRANSSAPWLRDTLSGEVVHLSGRPDRAFRALAWSPEAQLFAGTIWGDSAVLLWDTGTGRFAKRVEGHEGDVKSTSFSSDGLFLASKSDDNSERLWSTADWKRTGLLPEPTSTGRWPPSLTFHPRYPILATLGEHDTSVRIWHLDLFSDRTARNRAELGDAARRHSILVALEEDLTAWVLTRSAGLSHPQARRHLQEGFFQRHLMMIKSRRSLVEETFNRANQLTPELTVELNVDVNAYYLNVCGALDNLAWLLAFQLQLQPDLDEEHVAHRRFVALFGKNFLDALQTRNSNLADQIRGRGDWNRELRSLRDPAAHRIPLYVVPGVQTPATAERREVLEKEAAAAEATQDWHRCTRLQADIRALAIYEPLVVSSNVDGLQQHPLPELMLKDQEIFLQVAQCVLESFFGPPEALWPNAPSKRFL